MRAVRGLFPWRWPAPVFWGVVAVLALPVVLTALRIVGDLEHSAERWGRVRRVPVAVRELAPGEVVRADDIALREMPATLIPGEPASPGWAGRTVVWPVLAGEVLVESRLAPSGVDGASGLLAPGYRAVAVPSGPSGRPPLKVGDRVDVLATVAVDGAGPDAGPPTFVVAEAAVVVAVDNDADVITIALPADDAPRVVHAVATAAVTLTLRT